MVGWMGDRYLQRQRGVRNQIGPSMWRLLTSLFSSDSMNCARDCTKTKPMMMNNNKNPAVRPSGCSFFFENRQAVVFFFEKKGRQAFWIFASLFHDVATCHHEMQIR